VGTSYCGLLCPSPRWRGLRRASSRRQHVLPVRLTTGGSMAGELALVASIQAEAGEEVFVKLHPDHVAGLDA
jgi:hypothetical protein